MNNLIKKSFLISMVVMSAMWGLVGVVNVQANVAVAGDLVKSSSSPAVYYLDSNNVKHPFHHEREYMTWYSDFSAVKTIPTDEMVSYTLGSTVVVRPGTRLVQYVEVLGDGTWNVSNTPQVYAAGASGTLQKVTDPATAVALYGSAWESIIIPLPNYLSSNYTTGTPLTASSNYPTGTLVKLASASQVYYIDGTTKRPVTDAGLTANRFKMSYVVTASSLSGYTDGSSITALDTTISNPVAGVGGVAVGTGLTVALASDNPGANVTPVSATSVPLMKFNLTASADGAVTVTTLQVKRLGVGAAADFSYLYLYEGATRLTNGKTINSTTHIAQFVNVALSIPAGTTRTLTLTADIAATTSGNVSYFQILAADVTTTATINGSFPILSNTITLGSSAAGTVKVEKDGTLSNPSVGQLNAKVAQFKLTAGTGEDLSIRRLTLYETGTMNNSYLTNLKLYQSTTLLASVASVTSKGYVIFDLATPFTLAKNTNRIFNVYADINGSARNADTIRTYVDQTTDVYAMGAIYGYGATVDIGATAGTYNGTSTNYSEVTVQGGQFTVAMNGPISGTIAVGSTGVALLNFSVTSAVNAEIRAMRIELHKTSTDLDTDAATDCATGTDYISNVKVVDTDNGESTTAVNCGTFTEISGSDNGLYYPYTDYFTLVANKTRNFSVKADLNSSLTAGTYYATLGSSATTFYTFSSTGVKNTENNQYVTDIVPSTFSQGNNQTVAAAGLYVSPASNAVGTTIVQGTQKVTLIEFALKALSGSAVTISGMTMYGYIDGDASGATSSVMSLASSDDVQEAGMAAVGNVYANNLVTNFRIYDKTTDSALATNLNTTVESMSSVGAVTFSNMNWTIPAGSTHILAVVGDVTTSAFENGDTGNSGTLGMQKHFKMNFGTDAGITAVNESNSSVTMLDSAGSAWTVVDGNGVGDTAGTGVAAGGYGIASDAYIIIAASGTLNVTAESNPAAANVVANSLMVPVLNLKFQSTNEAFNVNKLEITQNMAGTYNRAVNTVTISYKNQAGTTVTASQQLISGVADYNITTNPLYVPANTSRTVNVYFDLTAINQTYAAYTNDVLRANFVNGTNFEAKGAGSSRTSLTAASNATDVQGNIMIVHGTIPTFTVDSTSGDLVSGPVDLYRFQVSAAEGTDLGLKKLSFKLSMTDVTINASTLYLKNFQILEGSSYALAAALTQSDTGTDTYAIYNGWGATGTTASGATGGKLSNSSGYLYQNTAANSGAAGTSNASSTANDVILVFNDDRLITQGQSKYYILRATAGNVNIGGTTVTDSVGIYLSDGDTSSTTSMFVDASATTALTATNLCHAGKYCLDASGAGAGDTGAYIIWSDNTGTSGNNTHTDIDENADSAVGTTATSSKDWFNGYKLKTLDVQRSLN